MKSLTIVLILCSLLVLISFSFATLNKAEEEEKITKFVQGVYPVEVIFYQLYEDESVLYDTIYDLLENVRKDDQGDYLDEIKNLDQDVESIRDLMEKMQAETEIGKIFKGFCLDQIDVPVKKLDQVLASYLGESVTYMSKAHYMELMSDGIVKADKEVHQLIQGNNVDALINDLSEVPRMAEQLVSDLAKLKRSSNKISETLIESITFMVRKIHAHSSYLVESAKNKN